MTLDKSIVSMVVNSVNSQDLSDLDNIDVVLVECLDYHMTIGLLNSGMIEAGAIADTTDKYAKSYISTMKNLKGNYTAYSIMRKYVKDNGIETLFDATQENLNKIETIYAARKELKTFNPGHFDPLMYNVSNLDGSYFSRMGDIHRKIMAPIFKFYQKNYNIELVNFIIEDSLIVLDNPGKKIKFRIDGVSSPTIAAHLNMDVIGVKIYLYNVILDDDSVLITIK